MNSQKSYSYVGADSTLASGQNNFTAAMAAERRISPVGEALNRVGGAQARLDEALDSLTSILSIVMGPVEPEPCDNAEAHPSASELQARIDAGADSLNFAAARVEALIRRLTL